MDALVRLPDLRYQRILENPIYVGRRRWNVTNRKGPKHPKTGKKKQLPVPEMKLTRTWLPSRSYREIMMLPRVFSEPPRAITMPWLSCFRVNLIKHMRC